MQMTLKLEDSMPAIRAFSWRVLRRVTAAGSVIELDDIISECKLAWFNASRSFDETAGVPFLAYLRRGMKLHVNRWVDKELKEHNASHLEFDAPRGESETGSLHDFIPDRSMERPDEIFEANDRREKQLARLTPRARQFVELLESPPKALVDILKGLKARQEYAIARGLPASPVPKRVLTTLVFRFMGASPREQTHITEELETKFKLKEVFSKIDGV
jgi:DNA-directed RNA polymerase specialized sigma24 family protein